MARKTTVNRVIVSLLITIAVLALTLIAFSPNTIGRIARWLTGTSILPDDSLLPNQLIASKDCSRLIGHTDEQIHILLGEPTSKWAGHFGSPTFQYRLTYFDSTTELFSYDAGSLFISYIPLDKGRICYAAQWIPIGVEL